MESGAAAAVWLDAEIGGRTRCAAPAQLLLPMLCT